MLSGGAAEKEDSSEREKGQSPLNQPSGTELSLNQPSGIELSLIQPSGTKLSLNLSSGTELSLNHPPGIEPSPIQPSGSEPSIVQPSGTEISHSQPLGIQAQAPLSLGQPQVATGSVKAPAPMPYFTGCLPGTVRLLPPRKGKVTSVVTMSSKGESITKTPTKTPVGERTWAKHVEETTCPIKKARLMEIDERYRNGTWDGIPRGFSLVVDDDGIERLRRITKDGGADKSKDIGKSEEDTALFNLGGTNAASNKSVSDDDGLGQDLDDMLNGMDVSPNGKGNVTPLLLDDENNSNNAVS